VRGAQRKPAVNMPDLFRLAGAQMASLLLLAVL
jgi:hypothetical protein